MKAETYPVITEEELAVLRTVVDSGKLPSKFAIRPIPQKGKGVVFFFTCWVKPILS
jgi:hypothetical protein